MTQQQKPAKRRSSETAQQQTAPAVAEPAWRTLKVPLIETGHYATRHIDLQLKPSEARTLRRIFDGLHERHIRLASGAHVDRPGHALRWLLQQIEPVNTSEHSGHSG